LLLSAEPFDDPVEGTLLDLWFVGGDHKVVRPPCQPHYYLDVEQGECELVQCRLLSRPDREVLLYRVDFPSLQMLDRYRHPSSFESHKRFVDVLVSEYGFACASGLPRVLSWDVESFTFSKVGTDWRRDSIRSISVWGVGEVPKFGDYAVQYGEDGEFGLCWEVTNEHDERWVITQFLKFFQAFDPDVWAGYNDGDYDVRLLLQRCNFLRIPCRLGRDGSQPYVVTRTYRRRNRERTVYHVRIRGRVHLDVLEEVLLDQTLYDLKGRGQVEVADHFGFAPILDVDHAAIPDERLAEVNLDDARCCFGLANHYLKNLYALCEELQVPLNLMVTRKPSHISNWFYGRAYAKEGIVSDGYNCDRFPQVFNRGGKPYQGALVRCFETGVFYNVEHWDYRGFYPSIMMKYNLSPETVSLVAMNPYTGEYRIEKYDNYWIIEVPDVPKRKGEPNWEKAAQFVCRVDMSKDGVTKRELKRIHAERSRLKDEYLKTKDERLMSRQYALKVIENTIYGYNGMKYALYGNVLVALLVTALARFHIQKLLDKLRRKGKTIIEVDTDGLYCVDNHAKTGRQ